MLSQDGTGGAEQLAHKPHKLKLVILVFIHPFCQALTSLRYFVNAVSTVRACRGLVSVVSHFVKYFHFVSK